MNICSPGRGPREVVELYNVSSDPGEQHNLAQQPAHRLRLHELKDWARELILQMVGDQLNKTLTLATMYTNLGQYSTCCTVYCSNYGVARLQRFG